MPVPYPEPYDTYRRLRKQRLFDPTLTQCPRVGQRCPSGPLKITGSTVGRTLYLLEKDDYGVLLVRRIVASIVLVKCPVCEGRFRLLPCDVLPYKLYSLSVIEHLGVVYERSGQGLRPVAWSLGGHSPAHTTLHAWTEGMGAWRSGRPGGKLPWASPADRARAEATYRYPALEEVSREPVPVSPRRYRSEARRDRLVACFRLIRLGLALLLRVEPVEGPAPGLTTLGRLALGWGVPWPISFPTGILSMALERRISDGRVGSPSVEPKEDPRWPPPTRSPPGDSSRSPPS